MLFQKKGWASVVEATGFAEIMEIELFFVHWITDSRPVFSSLTVGVFVSTALVL